MGNADLSSDPRPAEVEPDRPGVVEQSREPEPPTTKPSDFMDITPAPAAADPFDLLRAELRLQEPVERSWKDHWPWRWVFGGKRDPGGGRPP
jgi:hypothetical protein